MIVLGFVGKPILPVGPHELHDAIAAARIESLGIFQIFVQRAININEIA
jgi:hypothetical protein